MKFSIYPTLTGDRAADRSARTIQNVCLMAIVVLALSTLPVFSSAWQRLESFFFLALLLCAMVLNRAGRWVWAARVSVSSLLLTAVVAMIQAQDGFRSHAVILFPGLLVLAIVLLDRTSYFVVGACTVVAAVGLGVAEMQGRIGSIPPVHTPTNWASVISVGFILLAITVIGGFVAYDTQENVHDLRRSFSRLKTANEQMRQSEEKYRSLFEHMHSGFMLCEVLTDENGRAIGHKRVEVNQEWERLTGFRREQAVGTTSGDVEFMSPESATRYYAVALGAPPFQWEVYNPRLRRYFDARVFSPRPGQFALLFHDITSRHAAQERLRESEARFRAVVENSYEGVYFVDARGTILYRSEANRRMTGYSNEQRLGAVALDLVHPEDTERVRRLWSEILSQPGLIGASEHRVQHADGSWRWTHAVAHNLLDNADVRAVVINVQDITDRKLAEAAQEKLREELVQAQKLESIGRLAGGVAHDFNNLLTVINGQSELLLDDRAVAGAAKRRVESILEAGARAADLTRQLLAFSRQKALATTVVDLNEIVRSMRNIIGRLPGERFRTAFDLDSQPLPVVTDFRKMEQVLLNLCINARDAMPGGGTLRIRTSRAEWTEAETRGRLDRRTGAYGLLEVSDEGTGMDDATRRRAFEPFFTTKPAGSGTGLGLSMAQGVVAQSDGHIDVDTAPGKGTIIRIFLPLAAGAATTGPAAASRHTVLLLEDREDMRTYLEQVLKQSGYEVLSAADSESALRIAGDPKIPVALLIADVAMPDAHGEEPATRLAAMRPRMKVLLMSGFSRDSGVAADFASPPAFIQKPFGPAELTAKVREMLNA